MNVNEDLKFFMKMQKKNRWGCLGGKGVGLEGGGAGG